MFLTKECDYAIRVVRDLSNMEMKPVRVICANEHIPTPFAYKILKKLERARIVKAHRGAAGGYRLAKSPEHISLLEIVVAIDDHLFLNACLQEGHHCTRNADGDSCNVHKALAKLQEVVAGALMSTNINAVL